MKTAINFIITCYDKEEYLHGILETIRNYKKNDARIAICYNGQLKNFPCDIRIPNNGHQLGDIGLTLAGTSTSKRMELIYFVK